MVYIIMEKITLMLTIMMMMKGNDRNSCVQPVEVV